MVPLTVHEDAAPCTKTSSALCKSFGGLLGNGDEKLTKFLCHSTVKKAGQDCSVCWGPLLQDLEALGSGLVDGEPVAQDPDGTLW